MEVGCVFDAGIRDPPEGWCTTVSIFQIDPCNRYFPERYRGLDDVLNRVVEVLVLLWMKIIDIRENSAYAR